MNPISQNIAPSAAPIVAARLRGLKPAEMIRISLVGTLVHGNHTVYAKPGDKLDWSWVRGLDVCLYVGPEQDWTDLLKAIALHRPEYLCLWNAYEHWGAKVYLVPTAEDVTKPVSQWQYTLDFTAWTDCQNDEFLRMNRA